MIKIEYNKKIYEITFSRSKDFVANTVTSAQIGSIHLETMVGDQNDRVVYMMFQPKTEVLWVEEISESEESEDLKYLQKSGIRFKKVTSAESLAEFIFKYKPKEISNGQYIHENTHSQAKIYKSFANVEETTKATISFKNFIYKILKNENDGPKIMNLVKEHNPRLHERILGSPRDISNKGTLGILQYAKFHEFLKKNWEN